MIELNVKINDREVKRTLVGLTEALPSKLRAGLKKAGELFERDIKKKISGPGRHAQARVRNTAKSAAAFWVSREKRYPGVGKTGMLRATTNWQWTGDMSIAIGPNVKYAEYLEFGTSRMQPYAFIGPSADENMDKAMDLISQSVFSGVK